MLTHMCFFESKFQKIYIYKREEVFHQKQEIIIKPDIILIWTNFQLL